MYCYKYPRPAVTTDAIIFCFDKNEIKILLIKRKNEPFKNYWAFPGGFLDQNETTEQGVIRELKEETSLIISQLELLTIASTPKRDPRGRTISAVYWTIIKNPPKLKASDDAKELNWFSIQNIPQLAFDHKEIFEKALEKLRFSANNHLILKNTFSNFTQSEIKKIIKIINK